MATPWTPASDGKPRILCHHVASMDGGGEPERYETWFCSEHPALQRDRLATLALQGLLSDPTSGLIEAEEFAEAAYQMADAMLAARASPSGEGAAKKEGA
jgi:hypothetical protein